MKTLADTPVLGHHPDSSVQPEVHTATVIPFTTAAAAKPRAWTWRRVWDILIMIYAYGLLAFGVLFPLALVAWGYYVGVDGW